jgi:anti-anti-sigma factor
MTTRWSGDIPVVICHGRIVEGTESIGLDQHLENLSQSSLLILDLAGVDFIDSSGLGLLVRLAMRLQKGGSELKLCSVSPRIQAILKTTKLNTVLKSYDSEADAIAAASVRSRPKKSAGRRTDVMCVTDSADLLAYLEQLLRRAGYAVSTADNLARAETVLAATRPRILVIDSHESATISGDGTLRERFNALIDGVSIVELPAGFASTDAGEAGGQLLEHVRNVLTASQPGSPPELERDNR